MGWFTTGVVDEFLAEAGPFLRAEPVRNTVILSVTDTFGLHPPLGLPREHLFAPVFPDAHPSSCATAIYLQTSAHRYQPYSLLGGP